MSEGLVGKLLRVRMNVPLPPEFAQQWEAKFGTQDAAPEFAPVICGTLRSIDKNLNLVLDNVHIGAMRCGHVSSEESRLSKTQIATYSSLFIRGSTIQFAQIA